MDENNLQLNALKFVEKIITVENESNKQSYESWRGSSSHLGITDLSDYKIYIMISNIKYGFTESDYKVFYKLVYEISEWKNIQSNVSIDYLKEKTLRWIVDIYINSVYTIDLFSFLEKNLSIDVNNYKYCFPILNIDIDNDFRIGESKIKYFTKEYFDEFYKTRFSKDKCSEENFNKIYRKYQGQVFVEIEVFAESKKSRINCLRKCLFHY